MSGWKPYYPNDPKLFTNYFDPQNKRHCEAYDDMHNKQGFWPEWFQQELRDNGISFHDHWENLVRSKIIEAWINHKLDS